MIHLEGMGTLMRLIVRRDRIRLLVWVAVLVIAPVSTAGALAALYPTESARRQLQQAVATNPSLAAFLGPAYDASLGALTAWRTGVLTAVMAGIMAVLTVIRHTRDEEEAGRSELIGATVVGRHALLGAALAVTGGTGAIVGALLAAGLVANDLPLAGSVAFGVGFVGVIAAFAAVGALAAQLTQGGGAARGIAVTVVGAAFILRLAGDGRETAGLGWLSWLSPIGWLTQLRPFAGERWWVLGLWLAVGVVLAAVAFMVLWRRDVGAGALPSRPGPAGAGSSLQGPFGLAWRLDRAGLFGWWAGLAVVGLVYGMVADSVGELIGDNPQLVEIFELLGGEQALIDAYFAAATAIMAIVAAAYAVRTVLRLQVEEDNARAEPVLATATPRLSWAGSHLLIAVAGPVLMLAGAGASSGAAFGIATGDLGASVSRVTGAAVLHLPAVWVLAGLAVALYGLAPRLTVLAWGALIGSLLIGQLGVILRFPQWALNLSPFTHVPVSPLGDADATPLLVLGLVATVLVAAGLRAFAERDLQPG